MSLFLGLFNYWIVIVLMMTGFYVVISRSNLIKKVIGLNIFQTSVLLLYLTMGKVTGGTAPILPMHESPAAEPAHAASALPSAAHADIVYSHPLPSVLMLTAIVVGVATTSVALTLIVRIKEAYGTLDENTINDMDEED